MAKSKPSKRYKESADKVDRKKSYPLKEAIEILAKFKSTKFDETMELGFSLGVDPKHSDQMVRGTVSLPNGSGRKVKVLVFAKDGAAADAAKEAGADFVGFDEFITKCKEGWTDFDVAVATPEAMSEVRKLGRVLGPRGLMPNPKTGTVTEDTGKAVKEIQAGRVEFKIDKTANLHLPVGKKSFAPEKLHENIVAAITAITKAKPASAKGKYIKSCTLSSTMSPPIRLDV
ncbi:MAG TPA: 50S ribosomal protein L1 [Verrucomicrobiales bacterium]|nr:50S ribosomal protein L1 [Verrucomicrobiales bacterium]